VKELCFTKRATREIIWVREALTLPKECPYWIKDWQQWINRRDAVGRHCVGRTTATWHGSNEDRIRLYYVRGSDSYHIETLWEEITPEQAKQLAHDYQHAGLEPWSPKNRETSVECT
jgi:hypothetical protein